MKVETMNWRALYFGPVAREEVREAIKDPEWQKLRQEMKGCPLWQKYQMLHTYFYVTRDELTNRYYKGGYVHSLNSFEHDVRMLEVRCTNYVTALARGGFIKPGEYT